MHDRFRILTVKRPLPERSEAKEIFLVPTDAAQNPIIGPDLSEPSAYLPSREALQAHPSPNVCKNDFVGHVPVHPNRNLVLFHHVFWWGSSSRDLCSPEEVWDVRHPPVGIYILPDGCCFGIE